MAKGDDLQRRLIDFAVRILKVCNSLPRTRSGRHLADQLLRCGTAPAALYAEARSAESTNDFVHKLKVCLKELNESAVWLTIIVESSTMAPTRLGDLIRESDELARIVNASIRTARKNHSEARQ